METTTVGDVDVSRRGKMKGLYAPDEQHSFNQSINQLAFLHPFVPSPKLSAPTP